MTLEALRSNLPLRLLVAGGACALALIGLVAREGQARAAGEEIVLAMEPVDPRALLTGHYVILSFVDRLPPGASCPDLSVVSNRDGWLALAPNGALHRVAGAGLTRDAALQIAPVAVRGRAWCEGAPAGEEGLVRTALSVDRFHADQDEAEAIERAMRDRAGEPRVQAVLSVGKDGVPRTRGLIIDGRRVDLSWF